MRLLVAASLFAAALAAPAPQTSDCPNPAHCGGPININYENIDIADYFLRKNDAGIQGVNFKLSGDDVKEISCATSATTLPSEVVNCGPDNESPYKFVLTKPADSSRDADITIYHQTGVASGKWGEGSIPTYCHAGGNGIDDFVCQQVVPVTIVIAS